MLVPMSPADSVFLYTESREHPMHVGGLQLFRPPDGASARDLRTQFDEAIAETPASYRFRRRPRRSLSSFGQWSWDLDDEFDIEHHVRRNALPHPGRVLELLALCSRLHSTLLDRHRPLWEAHLIEGLADGRYATYFKVHHSMVDGITAQRILQRSLSSDPHARGLPPPWAQSVDEPPVDVAAEGDADSDLWRMGLDGLADLIGLPTAFARTIGRGRRGESASISFSAPRSIFNVPITGARRFAAQSWPLDRLRRIGRVANATVNDVVLAMCAGALRAYLRDLHALPDSSLIAMVPVSLHGLRESASNAVGAVMCDLGTTLDDPADRLRLITESMLSGKRSLTGMSQLQIQAVTALGMSPLLLPMLGLPNVGRPPFNLIISNIPGSPRPLYWNGARMEGLYPLSIPVDGQALNITVTSYAGTMAFGLTGCRRTVPHLQRLLAHLDTELVALEQATA
ncbi:MAG: wax ester/triacylglycerol synthase family O-acyltransferase [Actinobacteria bacterium]|nr:wax ester/triacylglycerol synthase family O-acyltransferase [Actinomycetota bacterium]